MIYCYSYCFLLLHLHCHHLFQCDKVVLRNVRGWRGNDFFRDEPGRFYRTMICLRILLKIRKKYIQLNRLSALSLSLCQYFFFFSLYPFSSSFVFHKRSIITFFVIIKKMTCKSN